MGQNSSTIAGHLVCRADYLHSVRRVPASHHGQTRHTRFIVRTRTFRRRLVDLHSRDEGQPLRRAGGEAAGRKTPASHRHRRLCRGAASDVCGVCADGHRPGAVAGILGCGFDGHRSDRGAGGADRVRGTIFETGIRGLQSVHGKSPVPADSVSLVDAVSIGKKLPANYTNDRELKNELTGQECAAGFSARPHKPWKAISSSDREVASSFFISGIFFA